jgi:hypothetical protein
LSELTEAARLSRRQPNDERKVLFCFEGSFLNSDISNFPNKGVKEKEQRKVCTLLSAKKKNENEGC